MRRRVKEIYKHKDSYFIVSRSLSDALADAGLGFARQNDIYLRAPVSGRLPPKV